MLKMKTISIAAITLTICAMTSPASAQNHPTQIGQPVLSQKTQTAEAAQVKTPPLKSAQKIKRVVKPVPATARATTTQSTTVYARQISAVTSENTPQTRFVYSRRKDDSRTLVYFSPEANKSR